MTVIILEKVPVGLRGELTRWMLEPKAGVFVGSLSAAVRDRLWEKVCQGARDGGCLLVYTAANEQEFKIRMWGDTSRVPEDFEGLTLIRIPN
ncbi:MAG: type I-E CRISPR-associated endoribonuclease Cas2e [Bacillota bacterium]